MESIPIKPKSSGINSLANTIPMINWPAVTENLSAAFHRKPVVALDLSECEDNCFQFKLHRPGTVETQICMTEK